MIAGFRPAPLAQNLLPTDRAKKQHLRLPDGRKQQAAEILMVC